MAESEVCFVSRQLYMVRWHNMCVFCEQKKFGLDDGANGGE